MKDKKNTNLEELVEQRIRFFRPALGGETVVVGVSGGPDSTALVHVLQRLRAKFGFQLHVAHFNHRLRRGAGTDQGFVARLADQLQLPYTNAVWHRSFPQEVGGSLEEAARLQRLDFFLRLSSRLKARFIALGHTQDDLAETVLMRLLRGTGLSGLRGILPQRLIGGVYFIRPLLGIRKGEILEFLKRNNISFRTDPTNRQTKFFRNRIRLKLLPLLEKEYNHNIRQVLCNLAETVAADYEYLEGEAVKVFERVAGASKDKKTVKFYLASLNRRPLALRRMLLRLAVERMKGDTRRLTLAHIGEVEDLIENRPAGAVVHLPGRICVRKAEGFLCFFRSLSNKNLI